METSTPNLDNSNQVHNTVPDEELDLVSVLGVLSEELFTLNNNKVRYCLV